MWRFSVSVLDQADDIRAAARQLLEDVKRQRDRITLSQASDLESIVRETEGWLRSVRDQLDA